LLISLSLARLYPSPVSLPPTCTDTCILQRQHILHGPPDAVLVRLSHAAAAAALPSAAAVAECLEVPRSETSETVRVRVRVCACESVYVCVCTCVCMCMCVCVSRCRTPARSVSNSTKSRKRNGIPSCKRHLSQEGMVIVCMVNRHLSQEAGTQQAKQHTLILCVSQTDPM
jgi:hypothetical protein